MGKPYKELTDSQREKENKRIANWLKENTRNFTVHCDLATFERIENYCKHYEITKAEFLRRAIQELD